jgi:hypothetical protein
MGIAMLMASVTRKMPKINPISRIAARDMRSVPNYHRAVFDAEPGSSVNFA